MKSTSAAKQPKPERAAMPPSAEGGIPSAASARRLGPGGSGPALAAKRRARRSAPPPATARAATPQAWPARTPRTSGSQNEASAVPRAAPTTLTP